jgi:hypothetical protein
MRNRDALKLRALKAARDAADAKYSRFSSHLQENPSCDHPGKWQGGKCPDPRCGHGAVLGEYLDVAEVDNESFMLSPLDAPISVERSRYRRRVIHEYDGNGNPPKKMYFWEEI